MASEIRVNKINSQTGVGTITLSPTGVDISGVTTASTLRATTGIITTLQVGTISGDGSALTGVAATDNVRTGILDVAGVGTFRNDVNIADKIIHLGDTNTTIRFPAADTITAETGGSERLRIDSNGLIANNARVPSSYGSPNLLVSGTDSTLTLMGDGSSNNSSFTGIKFRVAGTSSGDYTKAGIFAQRQGGYNDLDLIFSLDTAADANSVAISDEKVRITSDGKIGVNNTDPSAEIELTFDSGSTAPASGTAPKGIALSYGGTDGHNAGIWFSSEFGGDQGIAGISGSRTSGYNTDLKFYTNSTGSARAFTERAQITSGGFLKAKGNSASYHDASTGYHELIGDTAHDVVAKLKHNSSTGYGLQMLFNHANSGLYALAVRDYSSGNNDKAFIRGDGDLENANNSYGGISDVKLKENIVDAGSQWDDIKALKIRNFNFKIDESKTKLLGLVAQEAETVCPSLVKSQPDLGENNEDLGTETKVVKYSILYMKAVKGLQEAMARIEALEAEVAALKGS